ncbi:sensor histidine kinase [Polluticoccus soli]|uniref:sensor histidine kinase n=1 Tax=Polluticoccus soli TaxID=3034150 RepID=UPI0023E3160C|nr:histidine kinase [Flavipsychrobacter sp. JY13-12]
MGTKLTNWWDRSYSATRQRVLLHILFWILYLGFFASASYEHYRVSAGGPHAAQLLLWSTPWYLVAVYYFFIGTTYKYIQGKETGKMYLSAIAVFLLFLHAGCVFNYLLTCQLVAAGLPSQGPVPKDFGSYYRDTILSAVDMLHAAFIFLLYMFLPVGCKVVRDMQRSTRALRELKERNMQLELNLIKSQVSPHFLLNTLNNIYAISLNGTRQQIGSMILNLSDFLKYSLYDSGQEFVPLSKEIKLLENFMELEAIRSEFIKTQFHISVDKPGYNIPPFILFPLVENAFKHGTQQAIKDTHINVSLTVVDGHLQFRVDNEIQINNANKGGIGLPALKKKIEYYYPGRSSFQSQVEDNRYIAELQINGL